MCCALISAHVDTGAPLPRDNDSRACRRRARSTPDCKAVRQLEFALFDFRLHAEYEPRGLARRSR